MEAASSTTAFHCPVCSEPYNDSDHAQQSFPCGHSCCFACLANIFAGGKTKIENSDSAGTPGYVGHPPPTSAGFVCEDSIYCPVCRNIPQSEPIGHLFGSNETSVNRNELENRTIIVDILKQTRGLSRWNGPDDNIGFEIFAKDAFNWSEVLPMGEWNGMAPDWFEKRFQVDGRGLMSKLFLNYLQLGGMLPDSIGKLASLTVLSLGNNNLIHLPDAIGDLTSLDDLDVNTNQLSRLPDSMGHLTSLTKLGVGNNELTQLPDTIINLTNLTVLYVKNNRFTTTQSGKDDIMRKFARTGLDIYV